MSKHVFFVFTISIIIYNNFRKWNNINPDIAIDKGKSIHTVLFTAILAESEELQCAVHKPEMITKQFDMKISPSKTKMMVFMREDPVRYGI